MNVLHPKGVESKLIKLAETTRYCLFHGRFPGCYFMLSQGSGTVDSERILITCFGKEESKVVSTVDKFLEEIGIQEVSAFEELQEIIDRAKLLAASGAVPEWMWD